MPVCSRYLTGGERVPHLFILSPSVKVHIYMYVPPPSIIYYTYCEVLLNTGITEGKQRPYSLQLDYINYILLLSLIWF